MLGSFLYPRVRTFVFLTVPTVTLLLATTAPSTNNLTWFRVFQQTSWCHTPSARIGPAPGISAMPLEPVKWHAALPVLEISIFQYWVVVRPLRTMSALLWP